MRMKSRHYCQLALFTFSLMPRQRIQDLPFGRVGEMGGVSSGMDPLCRVYGKELSLWGSGMQGLPHHSTQIHVSVAVSFGSCK